MSFFVGDVGTVIDGFLLVGAFVLAGLSEEVLGIVLVTFHEVGVAFLEVIFREVVALDGALVNLVKIVEGAFVVLFEKIVAGEVEPRIRHAAVDGVLADEVLQ